MGKLIIFESNKKHTCIMYFIKIVSKNPFKSKHTGLKLSGFFLL
jgi:hypothetical protein